MIWLDTIRGKAGSENQILSYFHFRSNFWQFILFNRMIASLAVTV